MKVICSAMYGGAWLRSGINQSSTGWCRSSAAKLHTLVTSESILDTWLQEVLERPFFGLEVNACCQVPAVVDLARIYCVDEVAQQLCQGPAAVCHDRLAYLPA